MVGGSEKFYSVKLIKNLAMKPKINVVPTNNIMEFGLDFIRKHADENILVYLNDKSKGLTIQNELAKDGIEVGLINADTKGSPQNRKLIEEQMLPDGIWIGTDFINSGVNVKNKNMDYVLMLTDHHKDVFKLEQFPERIREKGNVKINLAATFNYPQVTFGEDWKNLIATFDKTDPEEYSKKVFAAKEEYKKKRLEEILNDPVYNTVRPFVIRKRLDTSYDIQKNAAMKMAEYYNEFGQSQYNEESLLNEDHIYVKNGRVEVNKNRIKYDIVTKAMDLITNHPSLFRLYLSKLFSIKWEKPQNFKSDTHEDEDDIFMQYPEEISIYFRNFQGRDGDFESQFPHMKEQLLNIKRNQSKYNKLSKKYALALELGIDTETIYHKKFDTVAKAMIMRSFDAKVPTTIMDKVAKKVFDDLFHLMYFDVKFEPASTELMLQCLKKDNQEYFSRKGGDPVISLGKFIHTYISSVDPRWTKRQVRDDGKQVYKWHYKNSKTGYDSVTVSVTK